MPNRRVGATLLGLSLSSLTTAQSAAPPAGQTVSVPVPAHEGRAPFALQAFLYRPSTSGKHPLVLLSHGSSGGNPKQEVRQAEQARFFTDRGYVVLVPMRRGRGTSGGTSLESENMNCDPKSWQEGLDAAYEDISAAITYGFSLPDVDPSKLVLAGESRGGFLSVAYAAQGLRRKNVVGVINFVGGWVAQAEDNCPIDFNVVAYRKYGSQTRVPELWLYGDHDRFYSTSSIKSYPVAYRAGGGTVAFNLIPDVPENGHWLPGFPALWSTQADQYLAARGLPSARR